MVKKIVITGPPCAGKTTLISMLRQVGWACVPEKATEVIQEGKLLPWVNATAFRKEVLKRQLMSEFGQAASTKLLLVDRGAFDGIAYCRATGVSIPSFFDDAGGCRYPLVFLAEALPAWENNGIRYEDSHFARVITPQLKGVYKEAGSKVVPVPFGKPEERLRFVLGKIRKELGIMPRL